jgi:hypothetical protein
MLGSDFSNLGSWDGQTAAADFATVDNAMQTATATAAATGSDWTSTLSDLLPKLALTYQQKQILDVQTARMKAGQPPLDASQYGLGVSVGVSPAVQTALLAGVGLLAAFLFLKKR